MVGVERWVMRVGGRKGRGWMWLSDIPICVPVAAPGRQTLEEDSQNFLRLTDEMGSFPCPVTSA